MKLLYCKNCHDIVKLTIQVATCACGATKGMYIDTLKAQYTGEAAIPLGIHDKSFQEALTKQPIKDAPDRKGGVRFEAFVIPQSCETFERVG